NGFADVTSGVGTIVVGLAAVIIGETLLRTRVILVILIGCVIGSIIYRLAIQLALSNGSIVGLQASGLNIATALLVTFDFILPRLRRVGASACLKFPISMSCLVVELRSKSRCFTKSI